MKSHGTGSIRSIERVVHEGLRVGKAIALGASVAELFDNIRIGVIQLNRRARILVANDCASAILSTGDGLTDQGGVLRASQPDEDTEFQKLLVQALPFLGGTGVSGSMTVSRQNFISRLVLHVSPVNGNGAESRQGRVGALVLVVDPGNRTKIDPDRVADILGLTPAESHIAVSLAEGKTLRDIAAETGRSQATIRWHIRHIFAKHGLSRQVNLVRLVMSLTDDWGVQR